MKPLIANIKPLIESVANFSEGRDSRRIDGLVSAMNSVGRAAVLDVHTDPDHNRSVITVAGEPDAVAEASLRGVGQAAQSIDLTRHTGAHPRIGAADVIPFVPLEGTSLADCAALAHDVGREIWARFRLPVYFYGAAALRPERAALENIRRGQFEVLADAAVLFPDRAPDVGGPALHPTAGAVAVGARNFLIACNVNLDTSDLATANKIARTVRASSGGLPDVKAIGVALPSRGLAQVSMNLTDFRQTPLAELFEAVRREAARYGVAVVEEEIVGLVPRAALETVGGAKPPVVLPSQILENRLAEVFHRSLPSDALSNDPPFKGISMRAR